MSTFCQQEKMKTGVKYWEKNVGIPPLYKHTVCRYSVLEDNNEAMGSSTTS